MCLLSVMKSQNVVFASKSSMPHDIALHIESVKVCTCNFLGTKCDARTPNGVLTKNTLPNEYPIDSDDENSVTEWRSVFSGEKNLIFYEAFYSRK